MLLEYKGSNVGQIYNCINNRKLCVWIVWGYGVHRTFMGETNGDDQIHARHQQRSADGLPFQRYQRVPHS